MTKRIVVTSSASAGLTFLARSFVAHERIQPQLVRGAAQAHAYARATLEAIP